MWTWEQQTGDLRYDGKVVASGYAGHAEGKNNPALQRVHAVGPLPEGFYTISAPHDSPHTGPYTLNLTPFPQNEMFGRADFRIHGDSKREPGEASEGCIILGRTVREAIWNSGDRTLRVIKNNQEK